MKKISVLLVTVVALVLATGASAALAQPEFPSPESPGPDAVFAGTEQPETLSGTNANDLTEGLGGGDYLNDLWGHDALFGEEGDDLVCWTRHDSCEIGNPPQRGVI